MTDLDPDVHQQVAEQQREMPHGADTGSTEFAGHPITKRQVEQLDEIFVEYKRAGQDLGRLSLKLIEVGLRGRPMITRRCSGI